MTGWLVPTSSVYWRFMLVVAQWKSAPRITCGRWGFDPLQLHESSWITGLGWTRYVCYMQYCNMSNIVNILEWYWIRHNRCNTVRVLRAWCDMMWYDVAWCDMNDVMWYDVIWCDVMMWCDMMWYDVIWCDMMWCDDVVWYDVIWCDMMWCDMVWYGVMWCDMVWYDMIWYDIEFVTIVT